MLVEYKGERFRVSDRTYESYKRDYPERAKALKIIKEAETYYNYDKLKETIEPTENTIKQVIIEEYINTDKLLEHAINNTDSSKIDEYTGANDMVRTIGKRLIGYDPSNHPEEIKKYYKKE